MVPFGAGFWIRALARFLDMLFLNLLIFIGGTSAGIILAAREAAGLLEPGWQAQYGGWSLTAFLMGTLVNLLFHTVCEGTHGATLGKFLCRIRVLRQDGRPANLWGSLVRSLGFYVDGLFFGIVAHSAMENSPLRQRYGDRWGKTIVVKTRDIPAGQARPFLWFILGHFVVGSIGFLLAFTNIMMKVC